MTLISHGTSQSRSRSSKPASFISGGGNGQGLALTAAVGKELLLNPLSTRTLAKVLTASALVLAIVVSDRPASANPLCASVFGASLEPSVPWFKTIHFDQVEQTLRSGKILEVRPLHQALLSLGKKAQGFTPGLLLVEFEDGTKAVWKPGLAGQAEVSAYKLARLVGSRLVPPTVEKSLDGKSGSLQFFVETPIDLTKLNHKELIGVMQKVPADQIAERDFFNFVFGNWDRHWGNILVDKSHSIVQIDNGAITGRQMVRYGELPYVWRMKASEEVKAANPTANQEPFPFDKAVTLDHPSGGDILALLKGKADPADLAWFILLRTQEFRSSDLSMRVAMWDHAIWVQSVGYENYGPIRPPVFPERIVRAYDHLTFENLRVILPERLFSDVAIREILLRRDEIVTAARHKRASS